MAESIDVDLIAYLILGELSESTEDASVSEDIASKMIVHSKKINRNNPNITLKL